MVRNNTNATKNSSLGDCIKLNDDGDKIEEVVIDCWQIKDLTDVIDIANDIKYIEKEYNIRCTLNKINIVLVD